MVFLVVVVAIIVLGVLYKLFNSPKPRQLLKQDWKKDIVYLYQFKRSPNLPNVSPYCVKVESFLRAHKIDYEVIGDNFQRSTKGLLPFIEINGEEIADSDLILPALIKKFNIKTKLPSEQEATLRVLSRTFDLEVFIINLKYKSELSSFLQYCLAGVPSLLIPILAKYVYYLLNKRVKAAGYGAHTDEDIQNILKRDLDAAEVLLGDKKYFGGNTFTEADASVYGHLSAAYLLPGTTPTTDLINQQYPQLKRYILDTTQELFADIVKQK